MKRATPTHVAPAVPVEGFGIPKPTARYQGGSHPLEARYQVNLSTCPDKQRNG